jgi:hypothetical protein
LVFLLGPLFTINHNNKHRRSNQDKGLKNSRTRLGLPVQAYVHRHEYLNRTLH